MLVRMIRNPISLNSLLDLGSGFCLMYRPLFIPSSSHAVTADITISETAKAAEFFCSDGIIITGSSTGDAVNPEDLKEASESVKLPIVLGSGVTCENVDLYAEANAYIIGSHFKKNGVWYNPVDPIKVKNFMSKMMH